MVQKWLGKKLIAVSSIGLGTCLTWFQQHCVPTLFPTGVVYGCRWLILSHPPFDGICSMKGSTSPLDYLSCHRPVQPDERRRLWRLWRLRLRWLRRLWRRLRRDFDVCLFVCLWTVFRKNSSMDFDETWWPVPLSGLQIWMAAFLLGSFMCPMVWRG